MGTIPVGLGVKAFAWRKAGRCSIPDQVKPAGHVEQVTVECDSLTHTNKI